MKFQNKVVHYAPLDYHGEEYSITCTFTHPDQITIHDPGILWFAMPEAGIDWGSKTLNADRIFSSESLMDFISQFRKAGLSYKKILKSINNPIHFEIRQ